MYEKNIADPLKDITSTFQSLQKQLENAYRISKVPTNFSLVGEASLAKHFVAHARTAKYFVAHARTANNFVNEAGVMYEKNIADPLKDITSTFQSLQKQLENAYRIPEVPTNFSLVEEANAAKHFVVQATETKPFVVQAKEAKKTQLTVQSNRIDDILKPLPVMSNKMIDGILKPSKIIENSNFAESTNISKQVFAHLRIPIPKVSAKSIVFISPNLNFPNIIIPSPIDDSIFPLVPEEDRTPLLETDYTTFIDEFYEERIPLEKRNIPSPEPTPIEISQRVLIVGGHSDGINQIVARFIEHLGFEAIILSEQPNGRRTRFEKFKSYTNVDFAIVLLTPDDVGRAKDKPYDELKHRPSQDTIFELAYLYKHLQHEQVVALYTEEIVLPSYLEGWIHVPMCSTDSWKLKLVQEMQFAGLLIDKNKLLLG